MAIAITNLTTGSTHSGSESSATTASVSPTANNLLLLSVTIKNGASTNPTTPTVTGNGLTWQLINSIVMDTTGSSRRTQFLFRALGASPSSGAITITYGETETGSVWVLDQVSGIDTSGSNGSGAIVQSATNKDETGSATSLTVTLSAFGSADNATYGSFITNDAAMVATAGSGFTGLAEASDTNANASMKQNTEYKTSNDTSVDISYTAGTGQLGGIAVELKAANADKTITVSDSITITETITRVLESNILKSDTITLTDTPTILIPFFTPKTTDSLTVTESVKLQLESLISVSDSTTLTEAIGRTLENNISTTESVNLTELLNTALAHQIAVNDSITTSESRVIELPINITIFDSVTATDSTLTSETISTTVSENIAISEQITASVLIETSTSETVTITENVVTDRPLLIGVSDNLILSELLSQDELINVQGTETVTITETITTTQTITVTTTENINVSEQSFTDLRIEPFVSETTTISESYSQDIPVFFTVQENVSVNENLFMFTDKLYAQIIENITVSEAPNVAYVFLINKSDSITLSESIALSEPHIVEYINKRLVFVDGRLAFLIVNAQGIPHYTFI